MAGRKRQGKEKRCKIQFFIYDETIDSLLQVHKEQYNGMQGVSLHIMARDLLTKKLEEMNKTVNSVPPTIEETVIETETGETENG